MVAQSPRREKCCINGCFRVLPIDRFYAHPRSPDGYAARCKDCEKQRLQLAKHGLSSADKAEIAHLQDGCAICGRRDPGGKGWVVDHDRSCCEGDRSCADCRRGILCQWCNTSLGYAQDDPTILRRMADYLESQTRLAHATRSRDSIRTDGLERTDVDAANVATSSSPSQRAQGGRGR